MKKQVSESMIPWMNKGILSFTWLVLYVGNPNAMQPASAAGFEKYNEEQFATVKLPGSSQHVSLGYMAEMGSMLILLRKGHSQLAQLSWGWKILRC